MTPTERVARIVERMRRRRPDASPPPRDPVPYRAARQAWLARTGGHLVVCVDCGAEFRAGSTEAKRCAPCRAVWSEACRTD